MTRLYADAPLNEDYQKMTDKQPTTAEIPEISSFDMLYERCKNAPMGAAERIHELEYALRNLLNDCINFDGSKLTDSILADATKALLKERGDD